MLRPANSKEFIQRFFGVLLRVFRVILAILLALVATYALNQMGIHRPLEALFLDLELRSKPACSQPGVNQCLIAIVMITDDDYERIFDGRSPLKPDKLRKVIAAIAAQRPKVIAVDIDTSHWQFRDLDPLDPNFRDPSGKSIPIIWERDVEPPGEINVSEFQPLDVLGGRDAQWNENSGTPVLLDDPLDKVTRFYTRCIRAKGGAVPSFVYAVKEAYEMAKAQKAGFDANHPFANHRICKDSADLDPRLIWFTLREKTIDIVSAGLALNAKENNNTLSRLKDRIVLLGGSYRDYDRHFTPFGAQPQPGAIVLANALQTEERPDESIKAPSYWELLLVEAITAVVLLLGFEVLTRSPARVRVSRVLVWGTLIVALAISIFVSYGSLFGLRVFAPPLLAVLVFEFYDYVRHQSIVHAIHPNGTSER
jgi:CHASE2 domain-containing sensor protein